MFSTLLALALVAQAEPAPAETTEKPEAAEQEVTEQAEDKRICRRITAGMGSRRKEKVCMTREEWREFNRGN